MKIKKLTALWIVLCMMFSLLSLQLTVVADEASYIVLQIGNSTMTVGNSYKEIDPGRGTVPVIKNGRTLVPVRAVVEEIGGNVTWNESERAAYLSYGVNTVKLIMNSYTAYLNGIPYTLDAAPEIINGRTMIPIRFVAESFNLHVEWDSAAQLITITRKAPVQNGKMKVHFIDVGQGDSIFVELPGGETMLIDAGKSASVTANYISSLGYSSITRVVATHPDADHITGMPEVLRRFSVGEFYLPDKDHTTNIFESMLDALADNGCSVKYAISGQQLINNAGASAVIIAPVRSYSDNNNSSAVVKLMHGAKAFLFTGDIEFEAESDIVNSGINLSADVLKVSHHGAESASSEAFIAKVAPKYAVISVGANNSYGHPVEGVLNLLGNYGAQILRTDESGTIIITSDGTNLTIDHNKTVIKQGAPPAVTINPIPASSANNSAIVYKTKTGSKYHMAGCSYLKSSIQTTVAQAKSEGLTACSRCKPPQ